MLPFADPTPESFLRELGFDCARIVSKTGRKYFLKGDLRLSVTCWGDAKQPEYILVEHLGGADYRAIVQTIERHRIRSEVERWRRSTLAAAAADG